MRRTLHNISELILFAQQLVSSITANNDHATLICLSGDLGAGKTALTKEIARALLVHEDVQSPTFVIERRYMFPKRQGFSRLIHIDAYRLNNGDELKKIHWDETLLHPENLIVLEWPEQVVSAIPTWAKRITLTFIDENKREVESSWDLSD